MGDKITERIMNIETPPAAGELNFDANKETYENYFINVAGILAAHNQFQNVFLLRLNRTLETFGLKLISLKIQHEREEAIRKEMYLEAERLAKLQRLRHINEANHRIREIINKKDTEIQALVEDITMIKTIAAKQEEEIDRLKLKCGDLDPYAIKGDLSGLGLTPKKDDNGKPDYGKGGYIGKTLKY